MRLSKRLKLIADQIKPGETMADIGTDHGFLPIYLKKNGICPHVILTDISMGSLEKAMEDCRWLIPEEEMDLRAGNGLRVLSEGEVDTVVMAGMGGNLITEILGDDPEKSHSFRKYILQPRRHTGVLRCWLAAEGYSIDKELLVRENRHLCEILVCHYDGTVRGDGDFSREPWKWNYPRQLIACRNELTEEYLQRAETKYMEIIKNIITKGKAGGGPEMHLAEEHLEWIRGLMDEVREKRGTSC